jgi:membrane-bound lytic murein transglycosylase D
MTPLRVTVLAVCVSAAFGAQAAGERTPGAGDAAPGTGGDAAARGATVASAARAAVVKSSASGPVSLVNLIGAPAPGALPAAEGHPEIEKMLTRPADLWERVRLGFAVPDLDHELVAVHEAWYAARPDLVRAILSRARRYLHFIVEEVERRGMPTELALLPVVESGFNPMALSSAQASGLWQFIPATGVRYNLAQNEHYDARRDIVASTNAALEYLQMLHGLSKDWHLALASYNWGEEAVGRATERARARGGRAKFGDLALPEETRNYVPRLQAVKNIIADPARFGIDLGSLPNEPYFTVIPNRDELPLETAAKLAGMTQEEFAALNPAWNLPRIPGARGPGLILPVDRAEAFRAKLEAWRAAQRPKPRAPRRPVS